MFVIPKQAVDLAALAYVFDGTLDFGNWLWTSNRDTESPGIFKIGLGMFLYVVLQWTLERFGVNGSPGGEGSPVIYIGVTVLSCIIIMTMVKTRMDKYFGKPIKSDIASQGGGG